MSRIVGISNFADERVSEIYHPKYPDSIESKEEAERICEEINETLYEGSTYYYVVKDDNYVLYDTTHPDHPYYNPKTTNNQIQDDNDASDHSRYDFE